MSLLSQVNTTIKVEEVSDDEQRFDINPLPRGFGHTLGNALRRMLLSSLEGAAITAVEIEGAQHEYDVLPDVLEDVAQILLNIKRLNVKLIGVSEGEEVELALNVSGKKQVTAKDFQASAQVEFPNPDYVIAELTSDNAKLSMRATARTGVGYAPVAARDMVKMPVGVLPVDAIYSPVVSAAYRVESLQSGSRADLDRLIMTIKTDGTVSSREALSSASQLLRECFLLVAQINPAFDGSNESTIELASGADKNSSIPVSSLDLSKQVINALTGMEIHNLSDLVAKTEAELLETPNIGTTAIRNIKEQLAEHSLSLGTEGE